MLKKKLKKAGYFGQGLLLLVPFGGSIKLNSARTNQEGIIKPWHQNPVGNNSDTTDLGTTPVDASGNLVSTDALAAKANAPMIPLNKHEAKFIKGYLQQEEEYLKAIKAKSSPYFRLIDSVFNKFGLPLQLRYLAVVESQLDPTAVSHAGAKGLWQLMPSTARDFGLKVNQKHDERTLHLKCTVAAAKYIKSLYAQFGDWILTVAAYNSGSGSIFSAIRKAGSRNFWAMAPYLPFETRSHVKRFIATHYFFEGKGSMVTLTKKETEEYKKSLASFIEEQTDAAVDSSLAEK